MPIRQLKVSGVRNLQPLDLDLHPGVNFIYGANGSGKTSVLEAINLMAAGKSFRTSKLQHVFSNDSDRIRRKTKHAMSGVEGSTWDIS